MTNQQKTSFKNIEDFYNENPDRRYSREADYGVNITGEAIITIIAHANEEQEVADLLAQKPFLVQTAFAYATDYFKQGIMDVALNALTQEQIRTLEDHSGKDMSEFS